MIKTFDTDKILFEVRQGDVPFNPNEVFKIFYDGDYSLPLGRVRLFRIDGKIYGRIQYYVNLEAYKKHYRKLHVMYPSLTMTEHNGKAEKILCCSLNKARNADKEIEDIGDQLVKRKIKQGALQFFRDAKEAVDRLPKEVPPGTNPQAQMWFICYGMPCHLYVDIPTREPLYVLFPGREGTARIDIR